VVHRADVLVPARPFTRVPPQQAGHTTAKAACAPSGVYFTATLDAAVWGAELASGEGRGRVYIVEPTGGFEDDPNVTDKKFPGNPTQSFRSREPLRVVGELDDWVGHSREKLQAMRHGLDALKRQGAAQIED
jgi:rifampin ADP-ribosylating transferase